MAPHSHTGPCQRGPESGHQESQRGSCVRVWSGDHPQDHQVMNDDPLILFNVRKNLLLKLLVTLQLRNSLRSNLVISKRMGPKMRSEGWLHQGNLRTIPKCCPSACRAELVATGPTHKCERTLCHAPHRKGDVRNSDTWP